MTSLIVLSNIGTYLALYAWQSSLPMVNGAPTYTIFRGNGSPQQGWPEDWISFDELWEANLNVLNSSCSPTYGDNNDHQEIEAIKHYLPQAAEYAGVPPQLFLAIMMQESDGCVRVGSTASAVTNPGLMQSNNGVGNCVGRTPCPPSVIETMLMEGAGQNRDFGLKQAMAIYKNVSKPTRFFRAARAYNAGPNGVDENHLEEGGATRCYASDIANRVLGWIQRAESTCPFDHRTEVPSAGVSSTPSGNIPTMMTMSLAHNTTSTSQALLFGTVPNSSPSCRKYHLVEEGDTCNKVAQAYGITFDQLRSLNSDLNIGCTNLWLGYNYCILGNR